MTKKIRVHSTLVQNNTNSIVQTNIDQPVGTKDAVLILYYLN